MDQFKARSNILVTHRRASPKVRTGCLTCKIRKVKCGEEKPICLRCIKFGVRCDGYATVSLTKERFIKDRKLLLPKSRTTETISILPLKPRFRSEGEHRYFEIFCSKTAFEILPCFDTEVFRLMLLQACESEPSIRHGIVAIGALDKTSQTARAFEHLSYDDFAETFSEAPNVHYQNALRHYATAITQMRLAATSDTTDLRTKLLSCLIILCFEAWSGCHQLALQQIETAIGLIEDWKKKSGIPTRSLMDFISPNSAIVEDHLIQIFTQLAIQVVFFAEKRSQASTKILGSESKQLPLHAIPESFGSFREAFWHHRNLTRRSTHFLSRSVPKSRAEYPGWIPSESKRAEDIQFATEHANLVANTFRWLCVFEPMLQLFNDWTSFEWRQGRVLRVQMLVTHASIRVMTASDEMIYDEYSYIFREIVDISTEIVAAMRNTHFIKMSNFSFDTAVIIPLYLTVMKCRNTAIRRDCIELLLSMPWREGIWDSFFIGRLGQWALLVEEEFIEDDVVPNWARISGVVWSSNLQRRTAILTCQQRTSPSSELRTRTKAISW